MKSSFFQAGLDFWEEEKVVRCEIWGTHGGCRAWGISCLANNCRISRVEWEGTLPSWHYHSLDPSNSGLYPADGIPRPPQRIAIVPTSCLSSVWPEGKALLILSTRHQVGPWTTWRIERSIPGGLIRTFACGRRDVRRRWPAGSFELRPTVLLAVNQSDVNHVEKESETHSVADAHLSGRPRATTAAHDRLVVVGTRRRPCSTAANLRRDLRPETGVQVSMQNIRNRPHLNRKHAYKPMRCPSSPMFWAKMMIAYLRCDGGVIDEPRGAHTCSAGLQVWAPRGHVAHESMTAFPSHRVKRGEYGAATIGVVQARFPHVKIRKRSASSRTQFVYWERVVQPLHHRGRLVRLRTDPQTPTGGYGRDWSQCAYRETLANRAAAAVRLACSPPTKANRVQSSAGPLPDDVDGRRVFSGLSRFPRPCIPALLHSHFTLIGSQDLVVKSRS
ncbi:hypothetical protein PR048_006272 [Dryococelus australis]|uniref:Uncharacterized protein n=1 Tax=Dryococelus australis TaxID=614101 RepID=A0ABQ9IAH4_9NEOP|nr:hypothetical protein PR048_006272 [Dryococelus australis]